MTPWTTTTPEVRQRRPFGDKLNTWLRRLWFGPRRPPGARRIVRCRYYGTNFIVNLEDEIGYEIAINRYEWRELQLMLDACQRLKPEIFLDIGANLGPYSCVIARRNPLPRMLAFEPDGVNFQRLSINLKLNKVLDRIELQQVAVGAEPGTAHVQPGDPANRIVAPANPAEPPQGQAVSIVRLDDALRFDGKTIAARIAIEGYELEVLMGAAQLLARNGGVAQVEGRTDRTAGVIAELMTTFGWRFVDRYGRNLRFEKP